MLKPPCPAQGRVSPCAPLVRPCAPNGVVFLCAPTWCTRAWPLCARDPLIKGATLVRHGLPTSSLEPCVPTAPSGLHLPHLQIALPLRVYSATDDSGAKTSESAGRSDIQHPCAPTPRDGGLLPLCAHPWPSSLCAPCAPSRCALLLRRGEWSPCAPAPWPKMPGCTKACALQPGVRVPVQLIHGCSRATKIVAAVACFHHWSLALVTCRSVSMLMRAGARVEALPMRTSNKPCSCSCLYERRVDGCCQTRPPSA